MKELKEYIALYFRHFKYFLKYGGIAIFVHIFFGVLMYVLYPIKLLVQGMFVDAVVDYYKNETYIKFIGYSLPSPMVFMFLWLLIVLIRQAAIWIKTVAYDIFRVKVQYNFISKDLVKHIHKFNLKEIEKNEIYNKLETFKAYWWNAAMLVITKTIDFIGAILSIILTFITIKDVPLWIIAVAMLLPLVSFVVKYIEDKKYRIFVEHIALPLRKRSYYINVLLDIRTFMERKVNSIYLYLRRLLASEDSVLRRKYKDHLVERDNRLNFWVFYDLVLLSLLQFYIVAISIIKKIQVGLIWANVNYINNFYQKSTLLLTVTGDIISNLRYVKDLYDIYDMQGFADKKHGTVVIKDKSKPPVIQLRNLSFKFVNRFNYVLQDVNLEIKPGQKILILGKDGAGKTAFVKILTTLFPVPLNTYLIDNIPVEQYARHEVKNLFSLVPEDFGRYYIPFKKNILLGDPLKRFDKKQYELAKEISGLKEWLNKTKINEDTLPLGTYFYPGIELPSGVWQRIAIARAVYRDRPIFILDEPFSYIDSASKYKIFEALMSYIEESGKTLIYIGEDVDFIDYFDAVYEKLHSGELIKISKRKALAIWASSKNSKQ